MVVIAICNSVNEFAVTLLWHPRLSGTPATQVRRSAADGPVAVEPLDCLGLSHGRDLLTGPPKPIDEQ
jgi:hypothetical protein